MQVGGGMHVGTLCPHKLLCQHLHPLGSKLITCSSEPNSLATASESACACSTSACAARMPALSLSPLNCASSCS